MDIYTGSLIYKDINFSFVFDKKELRLIPPQDKKDLIEHEWFMHKVSDGVYVESTFDHPVMNEAYLIGKCNEDGSNVIQLGLLASHNSERLFR